MPVFSSFLPFQDPGSLSAVELEGRLLLIIFRIVAHFREEGMQLTEAQAGMLKEDFCRTLVCPFVLRSWSCVTDDILELCPCRILLNL